MKATMTMRFMYTPTKRPQHKVWPNQPKQTKEMRHMFA